jgi:ABC-2 type transport system permease protein
MRTLSLLTTKIQATTLLSGASLRQLRERDQVWVLPLAAVGVVVGLGSMIWMLYGNYRGMAILGAATGSPELPFFFGTLVSWVFVFVMGFPIAISVLYFSRDTTMLAALPLRPGQIVAANVGLLYLYTLPVSLVAFTPAVVAYAGVSGVSFMLIVAAVLVAILLPLVPLGVSILLVTMVTRLVNLSRFRTVLEAAGMVLVLVGIIGLQVLFSRSLMVGDELGSIVAGVTAAATPAGTAAASGTQPGFDISGLVAVLGNLQRSFPPAAWVARSFMSGGVVWLLLTAGLSLAVILVSGLIVQAGYLRIIAVGTPTARRRTVAGAAAIPARRSVLRALVGRELRLLFSNSTFLFESIGELLVFPLLLIIFRFVTPSSLIADLLPLAHGSVYLLPIVLGVLLLFAGINTVSASALSREGATFDLSLSLPLSGWTQVRAKIVTYLGLFWPAMALNASIAVSLLKLPWWNAVVLIAAGLPFLVLIGSATIYADIRRPLLNWTHPQQAVKQNMNILVGMGLAILCVGIVGALPAIAAVRGHSPAVVLGIAVALALGSAITVYRVVCAYADRRYAAAFSGTSGT